MCGLILGGHHRRTGASPAAHADCLPDGANAAGTDGSAYSDPGSSECDRPVRTSKCSPVTWHHPR